MDIFYYIRYDKRTKKVDNMAAHAQRTHDVYVIRVLIQQMAVVHTGSNHVATCLANKTIQEHNNIW